MNELDFLDLPDLACDAFGGAVIACNDEFFAEKENLIRARAPEWREHAYTDRGKWMDGWETRRYRPADGVAPARDSEVHDWCVVRLGMPGIVRGVVVDTAFFRGNFPTACALYGTEIDDPLDLAALATATWVPFVPRSFLQGDHRNTFAKEGAGAEGVLIPPGRVTHVRLEIYPDGGVARLRVHGYPMPRQVERRRLGGLTDLAALELGARVETCSDMFFGSRHNLIKPGPSQSMADGWETRRRRTSGNDWAVIRLASAGTVEQLEIDTSHFKGNAPALCSVEAARRAPNPGWRTLLASQPLQPHTRHKFDRELRRLGDLTHLRLSVFPCGGVARLRAWGTFALEPTRGIDALNALDPAAATAAFLTCCGSSRWAAAMTAARPFEDPCAVLRIAERAWWSLGEREHLEAFAAHPRIGETSTAKWASAEQAGAAQATDATRAALADDNRAYETKHGFIYIVCASGRSADAMLDELRARLGQVRDVELCTAAEEQMKITRLRLAKLLEELR